MSADKQEAIQQVKDVQQFIVSHLPQSRETALVITKLDEARLWLQEVKE